MISREQWNASINGVDKYYKDNSSMIISEDDITGG